MDIEPVLFLVILVAVAAGIALPLGRDTAVGRLLVGLVVLGVVATLAFVGLENYFA